MLALGDAPGGVVNLLTGHTAELAPWLAGHAGVDALDLTGADEAPAVELERTAADTVKRVLARPARGPDFTKPPDIRRLRAFVELKTVSQPTGRRTGHPHGSADRTPT